MTDPTVIDTMYSNICNYLLEAQVVDKQEKKQKEILKMEREMGRMLLKMEQLRHDVSEKEDEVAQSRSVMADYQRVVPDPIQHVNFYRYLQECINYLVENLEIDEEEILTGLVKTLRHEPSIQFGVQKMLGKFAFLSEITPADFATFEPAVIMACAHAHHFYSSGLESIIRTCKQPYSYDDLCGVPFWELRDWVNQNQEGTVEPSKTYDLRSTIPISFNGEKNLKDLVEVLRDFWKYDNSVGFRFDSQLHPSW